MTGVVIIVEQFEKVVTDEREKGVAVDDSGLRLEEGVGAEAMRVDFEDKFSGEAVGPEWAGGRIRAHAEN